MVVVRFAPSPTGPLHIGGVRTALYNYLLARKMGGRFILRIEDTDQTRFVPGAEAYIIETFRWLGIPFTEGVAEGGEYGPYRQSDRKEAGIYQQYADQLVASGHAYLAFDTPEDLEAMRERLREGGEDNQQYNYLTRMQMQNSLSLPAAEVEARIAAGHPYVIRMAMPADTEIVFEDVVRGRVSFHTRQLDDKVLVKSDGMPTYHLANVVDDRLMQVTHVIRGEEWLASTPLHVALYEAFGWAAQRPVFVHLPLILNPNGQGKLSKRQADKLGFSVFPLAWQDPETGYLTPGFREDGYLPEALINFLALLGWNPGDDREIMHIDEMASAFSLERIGNSGAKFDLDKLKWFNQAYIKALPDDALAPMLAHEISAAGYPVPAPTFVAGMAGLMKERVTFVREMVSTAPYFLVAPTQYDEKMAAKNWKPETPGLMQELAARFEALEPWSSGALHTAFEQMIQEKGIGAGKIMAPLRLALTGMAAGPGVFDLAALLGKPETLARISRAAADITVSAG